MENGIHFISGMPRSDTTLLAAILRQNPALHAGLSSPVGILCQKLIAAMAVLTAIFPLWSPMSSAAMSCVLSSVGIISKTSVKSSSIPIGIGATACPYWQSYSPRPRSSHASAIRFGYLTLSNGWCERIPCRVRKCSQRILQPRCTPDLNASLRAPIASSGASHPEQSADNSADEACAARPARGGDSFEHLAPVELGKPVVRVGDREREA